MIEGNSIESSAPASSILIESRDTSFTRERFAWRRRAIFVALLLGYSGYYLCRQNISIAYGPMQKDLGLDPIYFGWITSIATFAYAIGKILTGSAADSIGGKRTFLLGLTGAAIFSGLFGVGNGIVFFIVAWSLNRVFQSMGWGGLVNVLARWYPPANYGTAMGFMSISYQFGGVLASLYAGMLLSLGLGWRMLFFVPSFTLAALGLLIAPILADNPKKLGFDSVTPIGDSEQKNGLHAVESSTYLGRFKALLSNRHFLAMALLSCLLTFLRECFNIWAPAYFSQLGASASGAAFKSAVFPLLGCVGTLFAGWFSDRFLQGRRAPVMLALLIGLVLSLLAMSQLDLVANHLHFSRETTAVILMACTGFFLLGPYSLVGGVIALDFGGHRMAGTAAGLLDGAGYLGATLSGIGLATLLVKSGWTQVFLFMGVLTIAAMLLCLFVWTTRPIGPGA